MSPPPSSSGSPTTWEHDVFLCFRGEDTRESFTGYLFKELDSSGIDTFMDDRLPKGRDISELLDRIEKSRISVVIFSENFASSRWCLDELVKILKCKETIGQEVLPVFYKVPPSELRDLTKGKTGEYLTKRTEKDGDGGSEKIERWSHAVKSFADLNGWHYTQGIEWRLVSEIVKTVHNILDVKITGEPPADQVTLEVDDASPAGRQEMKMKKMKCLVAHVPSQCRPPPDAVPVPLPVPSPSSSRCRVHPPGAVPECKPPNHRCCPEPEPPRHCCPPEPQSDCCPPKPQSDCCPPKPQSDCCPTKPCP